MQPYISQALIAVRVADMRRAADGARLAREAKRAARRARRGLAPVRPLPTAATAQGPEHAGRPAA
jgi:hypothetical protein